tara:strand:- start:58 stop:348 length:291 start_codon:yes stop_codon:yes gene_type:complete
MDILIYTTRDCFYCAQSKELLTRANLDYNVVEVIPKTESFGPDDPPTGFMWKAEFSRKFPGVNGFPYILIDEKPYGGLVELAKHLLKEGLISAKKR